MNRTMIHYSASSPLVETMPRRRPADENWVTVAEACELLGVSRSTLFQLMKNGDLADVDRYQPTPRKLFLSRADLEAWIKRQ